LLAEQNNVCPVLGLCSLTESWGVLEPQALIEIEITPKARPQRKESFPLNVRVGRDSKRQELTKSTREKNFTAV
jgi:hypothetical protein